MGDISLLMVIGKGHYQYQRLTFGMVVGPFAIPALGAADAVGLDNATAGAGQSSRTRYGTGITRH